MQAVMGLLTSFGAGPGTTVGRTLGRIGHALDAHAQRSAQRRAEPLAEQFEQRRRSEVLMRRLHAEPQHVAVDPEQDRMQGQLADRPAELGSFEQSGPVLDDERRIDGRRFRDPVGRPFR